MISIELLLVGITVIVALLLSAGSQRTGIPALVGYILFGTLLRTAESWQPFLTEEVESVFRFLSGLGIVCLLFHVGLDSKLDALLAQLRRASIVWVADVAFSAGLAFAVGRWLLDLSALASCALAAAFSATSVGVSAAVWEDHRAIDSDNGSLLIDVAELDDLSGVFFMALLFGVAAAVQNGDAAGLGVVLPTITLLVVKLLAFAGLCLLFSKYAEARVTGLANSLTQPAAPMLMLVGVGLIVAASAELLGFSIAIGAFFAGLVFSRDPEAVRTTSSFTPIYRMFTPFFFVHIGLQTDFAGLAAGFLPGLGLFAVAVVGKTAGTVPVCARLVGPRGAALIGASLVPHAEIMLVILEQSRRSGLLTPQLFSAAVTASMLTCVASPLLVDRLLRRWPQTPSTAASG